MIEPLNLLAILGMAAATYLTRALGYLAFRNRVLSPRARAVMDCAPGCVLVSLIAPGFATGRPADLIALAITALAAARLPMLPTVLIAIGAAAWLRHALG